MSDPISNFDHMAAIRMRNSRMRMEEQNRSTANASWNMVSGAVDDDENDVGSSSNGGGGLRRCVTELNNINHGRSRMTQNYGLRASLIQNGLMRSSSRASLIQNGLVRSSSKASMIKNSNLKAKGVQVIRKGSHLNRARQLSTPKISSLKFSSLKLSSSNPNLSNSNLSKMGNAKFSSSKLGGSGLPNASVMKRNTASTKYSYKLRDMLQSDLKVGTTTKSDFATNSGLPRTISASQHRRKIRKTNSLHEEFSQDIQILLKSLHSNEFVGKINPQYHARYVSDTSLM